jgi:predicted lipoprotein with Yx(FWY)xxD motif
MKLKSIALAALIGFAGTAFAQAPAKDTVKQDREAVKADR